METRNKPISALRADGRLYVDGVPYFIVSVQLDCDSCFTPRRIGELFHAAADLHCNTVAVPLYWRAVELKDVDSEGNVIVEGLSEGDEVVADAQNVKEGMYVY